MRISFNDGNAYCVYGGKVENLRLNIVSDYLMHADTSRWIEMGNGEYGPMKAMMFGRLEFSGPKMEAMSVMGPFESFLQLIGKIQASNDACPSK
jgi:putative sterol carrier protein